MDSIYCIDGTTYDVNYGGLTILNGQIWSVWNIPSDEETSDRLCVTIGDEVTPGGYTANTQYNSCYECLSDNYGYVILSDCNSLLPNISISISEFGFIPSEGDIFYFEITNTVEGTYKLCMEVSSIKQTNKLSYDTNVIDYFTINQIYFSNYSTCEECLYGFSSNTESLICSLCPSGETQTGPHPQWTNQFGQTVYQMNSYTLGGPNGLNS